MPGGDVSIRARIHTSGLWITVPIEVQARAVLWMVLDTGSPVSAISTATEQMLAEGKLIEPGAQQARTYLLRGLAVQGQPLPDLRVRVLRRLSLLRRDPAGPSRADVDGLLGLDFFGQFSSIHFDVAALQLRLVDA